MPVPKFLQSCLWSYDLKKMAPKKLADKRIIIQQVLNYGDWPQVQWLLKTYSRREIKNEIKRARRGVWFKEILDYWLRILNLRLPKNKYEIAIFNINPQPKLWRKMF